MFLNKNKIKEKIVQIIILIFVISILLYSSSVVSAAQKGLLLWFNVVFPSLFPFAIGTQMMLEFGIVQWIGTLFEPIMKPLFNISGVGAFSWIIGMTSGYPMGSMITADLVKKEELTIVEGQRLLSLCNQSGPLFIMGAVSIGMLKWPPIGIYLLMVHYLSALSVGFLFRFYKPSVSVNEVISLKKNKKTTNFKPPSLGAALKKSVLHGMDLLLQIGGFIILFSVIIELLKQWQVSAFFEHILTPIFHWIPLHKELQRTCLFSVVEITNGIQLISETSAPVLQKLVCISGCIAWSGFSIHAQTASILQGTQLKMSTYIVGKGIQSLLASVYTILLFPFVEKKLLSPAFYSQPSIWTQSSSWYNIFIQSTLRFGIIGLIFIGMGLLCSYFLFPRNS
ncbi:MAG: sporulation integral membrane protein YlbJ [Epulopiscium sp.]|nr:sporulation integral membrane protein YlbJ [Candidatus Epulonipiscium sp.]